MVMVIAEAGVNHGGRLDYALRLVHAAKDAGADAVKFQAFTPFVQAPGNYETQAMLKGLALTRDELVMIKAECDREGIEFMVTPMDEEWLEFCVGTLKIKRIKIGSGQSYQKYSTFMPAVAAKGLPVIMSCGMTPEYDIERSLKHFDGCALTLLYCVSKYPTPDTDISIARMLALRDKHGVQIGISSHCRSFWPCVAAAYAGASVIEVHVKLSEEHVGPDMSSSLLPSELAALVREVRCVGA